MARQRDELFQRFTQALQSATNAMEQLAPQTENVSDTVRRFGTIAFGALRERLNPEELSALLDRDWLDQVIPEPADVSVREHFSSLLAEQHAGNSAHPAWPALAQQLHPDEARLFHYLCQHNRQLLVELHAKPWMGTGSRLIHPAMTLIQHQAELHVPSAIAGYLQNLQRLGLVSLDGYDPDRKSQYDQLINNPTWDELKARIRNEHNARLHFERRVVYVTELGQNFYLACRY